MVNFFYEGIDFELVNGALIKDWICALEITYGVDIQSINYIFCSDDYLLGINNEHLKHDYYTDIITFDMRDAVGGPIEADIFISIDRVRDNSKKLNKPFEKELCRVLAHGLLHLIGFKDKTESESEEMRAQEDKCLSLLSEI